jgi:hypothetical protein
MANPSMFPMSAFSVGPGSMSTGISSPQDLLFGIPGYNNQGSMDSMMLENAGRGVTSPGSGFGVNMDTAKLALSGLGTIGNLWAAFQAQKLAKRQFDFTKRITETNLANQVKSYNTTLEDRGRSRAFTEGQDASTAQSYIDKNRLTTGG